MLLKPRPPLVVPRKPERLPKRDRMTLAIGIVCKDALVIAADTRISYNGGAISDAQKVTDFSFPAGRLAVAHSSNDVNAADTLIGEIGDKVKIAAPRTFRRLEEAVKQAMKNWYLPVHDNRPTVFLLLGACLADEDERTLYFCEPPNTMSRVRDTYKAIGDGWIHADPIYKEWFRQGAPWPLYSSLYQLAYLMHKAKQREPGTVGGHTDAVVLTDYVREPIWIDRLSMHAAETSGNVFDALVAHCAALAISVQVVPDRETAEKIARSIAECGMGNAGMSFRSRDNEIIRHEFYT